MESILVPFMLSLLCTTTLLYIRSLNVENYFCGSDYVAGAAESRMKYVH